MNVSNRQISGSFSFLRENNCQSKPVVLAFYAPETHFEATLVTCSHQIVEKEFRNDKNVRKWLSDFLL